MDLSVWFARDLRVENPSLLLLLLQRVRKVCVCVCVWVIHIEL
jgi:hypothetical protein